MPEIIQAAATGAGNEQVHGQLIPLDAGAILLPNSAVLDVVSLDDLRVSTEPPSWRLGELEWRGKSLPVISVEGLLAGEVPVRIRRSRVVIINSFGDHLEDGLFGLLSQGHPHLMTLNRAAVGPHTVDEANPEMREFILGHVRIANARAFIPDLAAIELQLSTLASADNAGLDQPWEPTAYPALDSDQSALSEEGSEPEFGRPIVSEGSEPIDAESAEKQDKAFKLDFGLDLSSLLD